MCESSDTGRAVKPFFRAKSVPFALCAVFMLLSFFARGWYYLDAGTKGLTLADAFFYVCIPLCACLLLPLLILFFGRTHPAYSFAAVIMGIAFFAYKALFFPSLTHTLLCLALYAAAGALWLLTVLGVIRTPWLLRAVFACPLLYHLIVTDAAKLFSGEPGGFMSWLPEISVLFIMAGLLCSAFSLGYTQKQWL